MAKKDDAPAISLFSFQDIITSLTGIMFLIVLLLVLFMLEMRPKEEAEPVPDRKHTEEIRKQIDDLKARLAKLRELSQNEEKRLQELEKLDLKTIDLKIYRTRKEILTIQQSNDVEEQKEKLRKKEIGQLKETLVKSQALQQEQEAQLRKQKQELDSEREINRELQKKLKQIKSTLNYTVENQTDKLPVLIEFSKDNFQVLDVATQKKQKINFPAGDTNAGLSRFLDWLTKQETDRHYYTLLLKPESFDFAKAIREMSDRKIGCGMEILPDDERTIFSEAE